MAFIRRDVNFILLALIVASVLLFSGFSVYYQKSFKNVSLDYKDKLEMLNKVSRDLATQKQMLNETYSLRLKAEKDRKVLDQSYNQVRDENSRLENDKSSLQNELSSTKSQLGEKQAQLEATKNTLAQTQSDLASANSRITSLKNDLDEVCSDYTSLNEGTEHEEC
jgi:chromosome segregation ATPase